MRDRSGSRILRFFSSFFYPDEGTGTTGARVRTFIVFIESYENLFIYFEFFFNPFFFFIIRQGSGLNVGQGPRKGLGGTKILYGQKTQSAARNGKTRSGRRRINSCAYAVFERTALDARRRRKACGVPAEAHAPRVGWLGGGGGGVTLPPPRSMPIARTIHTSRGERCVCAFVFIASLRPDASSSSSRKERNGFFFPVRLS